MTSTRSADESLTSRKTSRSSLNIAAFMAFFFSGRLRVSVTTPFGARSTRRVSMLASPLSSKGRVGASDRQLAGHPAHVGLELEALDRRPARKPAQAVDGRRSGRTEDGCHQLAVD